MNVNELASAFDVAILERQFYRADAFLDKAVGQFKKLLIFLKKY
jgi:hypothetical protein